MTDANMTGIITFSLLQNCAVKLYMFIFSVA